MVTIQRVLFFILIAPLSFAQDAPRFPGLAETMALDGSLPQAINVKSYGAKCDWNGTTGTDDTAAIQNAIDAAQTGAGAVFIPVGGCMITGTLRIGNTISVFGAASGGLNQGQPGSWDTFHTVSAIVNTSTNQDAILIKSSDLHGWMAGVRLANFAVVGNRDGAGAVSGSGIVLDGPDDQHLRETLIVNVLSIHNKECGFKLSNNVYGTTMIHPIPQQNGTDGICIVDDGLHGGGYLDIYAARDDLNRRDALRIAAPHWSYVHLYGGYYADSLEHGINVTSASTDMHLLCDGCHMESNKTHQVNLDGGYAHVFQGGCMVLGAQQGKDGFHVNNQPGNFVTPSATIRDCEINSNTGMDFNITAHARNVQLYAQAQLLNTYTIVDQGSSTQYYGAPYQYGTPAW